MERGFGVVTQGFVDRGEYGNIAEVEVADRVIISQTDLGHSEGQGCVGGDECAGRRAGGRIDPGRHVREGQTPFGSGGVE